MKIDSLVGDTFAGTAKNLPGILTETEALDKVHSAQVLPADIYLYSQQGVDLRKDKLALQRLKEEAEKAKKELSTTTQYEVNLPFISMNASGPLHLNIKLSRAKLEALVEDLIAKTVGPCEMALKDAGLKKTDIDEIILVGGSTRIPAIQEAVKKFFGKEPSKGARTTSIR